MLKCNLILYSVLFSVLVGCSRPTKIEKKSVKLIIDTVHVYTAGLNEEFIQINVKVFGNPSFNFKKPFGLMLIGTFRDTSNALHTEGLFFGTPCLGNYNYFKSLDSVINKPYKILQISGFNDSYCILKTEQYLFDRADTLWVAQFRFKKEGGTQILEKWPIQNKAILMRSYTKDPSGFKKRRDSLMKGKSIF